MAEELAPLKKRTIAVQNKAEAVQRLVTSLEDVVNIRDSWLADKKAELERAVEANKALAGAGASETKLRYSRNRVSMLRKVVNIIESGFVPIPRFSADTLNIDFEQMPLKAIAAVSDAKASGLFDEIKVVRGTEPFRGRGIGERMRRTQRDPLLIGIVGMPGARLERTSGWPRRVDLPPLEEHFLLCWWRPEDEVDWDMF